MLRSSMVTPVAICILQAGPLSSAIPTAHQQSPRFELSADTALIDEPIAIALSGLAADREVTVRLTGMGPAAGWKARARFRADARGRVDLGRSAPVGGDYIGVHAMGLFWSAKRDSSASPLLAPNLTTPNAAAPPPKPWELAAEVDGKIVARDTVWRRDVSPAVTIVPLRERGLVGTLYVPPGAARKPAVIVLIGSTGGIAPPSASPGGLSSRGYVVLALGYFATEGLPPRLVNIPLEYFGTALRWLAAQPSVDSSRIAVLGQSRGAELALLMGAIYPEIHAVVAYAPSHVAWPGTLTDSTRAPAWTRGGQPVPGMYGRETPEAVALHAGCPNAPTCAAPLTVHEFLALLDDSASARRAEIEVERINGPVFLVSGREDGLWPSTLMAEHVVARLRANHFPYRVEHAAYDGAGHSIGRPYIPLPDVATPGRHPITGRTIMPGGTPAGTALASEDSWRRVLAFLDEALRRRRREP